MSAVTINTEMRTRYNSWVNKPPTEYPNETIALLNPPSLWARFGILTGQELQMDIGTGKGSQTFRTSAVLTIQLFAPLNQGNNSVLTRADEVAALFRNWCGTTITCRAAYVEEIGVDNQGYFQVNVIVPFHQDNIY